jgi:mono/diheme cytochrome c family protein
MSLNVKRLALGLAVLLPLAAGASTPQQIWEDQCVGCHGANGDGKTKEGIKLRIKDYTDSAMQAAFTDSGLLRNLLLGVSARVDGDRMPSYKDKLTIAEAKELVAFIRTLKK